MNYKVLKFLLCLFLLSSLFLQFTDTKVLALEEPVMQVLIRKNSSLRIRSDSKIPLMINSDIFFNKKVKALTVKKNENSRWLLLKLINSKTEFIIIKLIVKSPLKPSMRLAPLIIN